MYVFTFVVSINITLNEHKIVPRRYRHIEDTPMNIKYMFTEKSEPYLEVYRII